MNPRNKNLLGSTIDSRLVGYATLAGAALAAPTVADATIVYSGPVSIAIPATLAGVYINVVTGVNNTVPASVPGWDINPFSTSGLSWFAATPTGSHGYIVNLAGGSSATLVDNLPLGTIIQAAGFTFGTNNAVETTGATAWNLNSDNNYVGFRFLNEGTSTVNFGWAQVHLGATLTDPARTVIGYAFEDTGAAIASGAIPEPSTTSLLGAMAAGAVCVRAWRKRKVA